MNNKLGNQIYYNNDTNDELYTPPSLSKKFIQLMEIPEEDNLLDPFYGTGSFFNNFNHNEKNAFCELNLGKDFFKYNIKHDWIISNPPFSQLTKILEHTCKLSIKGFGYVMPAYALSLSRIKKINLHGFYINKIIYFSNPKEWRLGFQMLFIIFTRTKNTSFINLESKNYIQRRLLE